MRILLVAATAAEVGPLVAQLGVGTRRAEHLASYQRDGLDIDVLVTGVGITATAVWCARTLALARYDVAFDLGLCGSFDTSIALGAVVHVTSEALPELGAEDGASFLPAEALGLVAPDAFPFTAGRLVNGRPPRNAALAALPAVTGITVSTAHGDERSIAEVVGRVAPQVESMEGAAFMYACLVQGVPFAEVRAVSNVVERRNRAAWRIPEALEALARTALAVVDACGAA